MQEFPGILDTLAPYTNYLWLLPTVIVTVLIGRWSRGSELHNKDNELRQFEQARDLKLRTMQSHMDTRENEVIELQSIHNNEISTLRQQVAEIEPLKVSLGKTKTLLAQVNKSKISQQREFSTTQDQLNIELRQLKSAKLEAREFSEKYSALQTKYKQMGAKRSLEQVDLQQEIVALKASGLTLEKDRNEHASRAAKHEKDLIELKRVNDGDRASYTAITIQVREKDDQIGQLNMELVEATKVLQQALVETKKQQDVTATAEDELAAKIQELTQAKNDFTETRKLTDTLTGRLQNLTDTSQQQLTTYDKQLAELTIRMESAQVESSKQITALRERVSEIRPLTVANKNKTNNIERLEKQLKEQQKRTEKYQQLETALIGAQAENDSTNLQLETSRTNLKEQSKLLDQAQDNLRQSQFESKKIVGLQNQLNEKNTALKLVRQQLVDTKTSLRESTNKIEGQSKTVAEHVLLVEKHSKTEKQLTQKNEKIAGLIGEVERSKSIQETLFATKSKLAETVTLLESTDKKLNSSESARAEIDAQLQVANKTRSTAEQEIAATRDKLSETVTLLESTSKKLVSSETARGEIDTQLLAANEIRSTAELKVASTESSLAAIQSTLDAVESRYVESQAALDKTQTRLEGTESSLSAARTELADEQALITNLKQDKTRAENLEERLTGYKQTITQLNQSVSEYKTKADKLQKTEKVLYEQSAHNDRLDQDLKGRRAEITVLNRELVQFEFTRKKVVEQEKHSAELKLKLVAEQDRIQLLDDALDKAIKETRGQAALIETLEEADKKHQRLKQDLQLLQSSVAPIKADVRKLNGQLEAANNKNQALQAQRTELTNLKSDFSLQHTELSKAQSKTKQIVNKLDQKQNELASANKSLKSTHQRVSSLESKLEQYQDTLSTLDSSREALGKAVQNLEQSAAENNRLEQISVQAIQDLENQGTQHSLVQKELQQTKTAVIELQKTAEQLKATQIELEHTKQISQEFEQNSARQKQTESELQHINNKTLSDLAEKTRALDTTITRLDASQSELQQTKLIVAELEKSAVQLQIMQDDLRSTQKSLIVHEKNTVLLKSVQTELNQSKQAIVQLEKRSVKLDSTEAELQKTRLAIGTLEKNTALLSTAQSDLAQFKVKLTALESRSTQFAATELNLSKVQSELDNSKVLLSKTEQRLNRAESSVMELERTRQIVAKLEKDSLQLKAAQSELHRTRQATASLEKSTVRLTQAEAELKQMRRRISALESENRMMEQMQTAIGTRDAELVKLKRENDRFRILEASIQDRQNDINKLQAEINSLSRLEQTVTDKEQEIKKLKPLVQQLRNRDSKIAELNAELSTLQKTNVAAQSMDVDLTRLQSEVRSLTNERDLGLQRVRELSTIEQELEQRETLIKHLKADASDIRINTRELDMLRTRLEKFELELSHKNETIEDLKQMLKGSRQQDRTSSAPVLAKGPSVVKTHTARARSKASTVENPPARHQKPLFTAARRNDDLKKIHGIGPVMEKTLNQLGINSYAQIAQFSANDISRVTAAIDTFPGRVERDDWVGGALVELEKKRGKEKI